MILIKFCSFSIFPKFIFQAQQQQPENVLNVSVKPGPGGKRHRSERTTQDRNICTAYLHLLLFVSVINLELVSKNPLDHSLLFILLRRTKSMNEMLKREESLFRWSLIIVILGFKVICYSQDFWQKSPLMFMITAIHYLRLTYKLTMFFDALEFWSANFCQATAHETSHPTEYLWREVQNQAEIGV